MKSYLEGRGIKCWKAPEDIPYGTDWDVGIVNGLSQCMVMVLIFSKEADDSGHVKKELVFADKQKKMIIPFKIDAYMPANLAYFLALPQWLDGIADIENAFNDLYNRLCLTLDPGTPPDPPPPPVGPGKDSAGDLPPVVSQAQIDQLLAVLPEYKDWATNSDIRDRLRWSKDELKAVAEQLDREGVIIYRDGSGGALAIKTPELTALETNLLKGTDTYPFFVNVGEGPHRNWEDFRQYGFFCAGNGERFAKQMQAIPAGAEVYLYLSQYGYVAKAKTKSIALPMDQYLVNGSPLKDLPLAAPDAKEHLGNHELCEWLISVEWEKSLDRNDAIRQKGLYVHVATSCRIKDPITVKYLREVFQ